MGLEFKDILKWTPSTISIVDEPYHPLAYFEVYENDEEFVKKYREIDEVKTMSDEQNKGVTMSEGFFEKLLGGLVAKSNPEPQPNPNPEPQGDDEEVTNAEILEALNKFDERLTAIENSNNPGDGDNDPDDDGGEGSTQGQGDDGDQNPEPVQKTVELPLNEDGTLNMEDGVVAKYLPRGTSFSQSVDGDLQRGNKPDKSFNERSGRNSNGMSW